MSTTATQPYFLCGRCKAEKDHMLLPGTSRMIQCSGCGFISGPITDDDTDDVDVLIPRERIAEILHEIVDIDGWALLLDELAEAWDERADLGDRSCRPGERPHLEEQADRRILDAETAIIDRLGDHYVNLSRSRRLRLLHGGAS